MTSVLLVDDHEDLRMTAARILEKCGLDVIGLAADGMEGVEQYKKLSPDVVLLDIDMPKMSGADALKEIINYDKTACVIMVTAVSTPSVIDDCLTLGAADHLSKDTPALELVEKIKAVFAEHTRG